MRLRRFFPHCLAILLLTIAALPAAGQAPRNVRGSRDVVSNPTVVSWDHVDFAATASYQGGYFAIATSNGACDVSATPATDPTSTENLGAPNTTGTSMTGTLTAKPAGCFVYRIRALGTSGLYSAWSVASDPFGFPPAAPTAVLVK
jgi:hypothetical protein